jgi:molybdate transport system substrate-binding protein
LVRRPHLVAIACVSLCWFAPGDAGEVRVAVASNFVETLQELTLDFEAATGDRLLISSGSTGKLHAQISSGAPFEVFLAADANSPRRLEQDGSAVAETRFTYALGRLALWTARPGTGDLDRSVLKQGKFRHIALANPRTAPYGAAAKQVLEAMDLWETVESRLVFGENVAQAFSFVSTANAEIGFVALAQVNRLDDARRGSFWVVPRGLHGPIEQQAVLLAAGRDNAAAIRFVSYLRSPTARSIIERAGYEVESQPEP